MIYEYGPTYVRLNLASELSPQMTVLYLLVVLCGQLVVLVELSLSGKVP